VSCGLTIGHTWLFVEVSVTWYTVPVFIVSLLQCLRPLAVRKLWSHQSIAHAWHRFFFSLCTSVIFYDCSFRIFFTFFACWFIRVTYLQGQDQKRSLLCPVLTLSLPYPRCGTSATDVVSLNFSVGHTVWYVTFRIHCHKFLFSLFHIYTLRMKQVYLICVWHNLQHHFHYTCMHPTNQWLLDNTRVKIVGF